MQTITTEILKKHYGFYEELQKVKEELTEWKKKTDANNDNEIEMERDGKIIKVKEEILWVEVYHLGVDKQAGKILREKYPELFKLSDKEQAILQDVKEFEVKNFGFYHKEMTMPNEIKLIRSLIKYELDSAKK